MGPLSGVRVVELGGIGPCPFAGMLLGDLGAEVVQITRPGAERMVDAPFDIVDRGKRFARLDLKSPADVDSLKSLIRNADVLIEGFRPGVAERLGLGPDDCWQVNARLVYGRITGWGQQGPLAQTAGHDLNYIALVGALHAFGRKGAPPTPPLNLVGDYGGGALYLVVGVLAALWEARNSGKGQVVDAAMIDGAASLMSMFYGLQQCGAWQDSRGVNNLDTGAYYYDVYETSDGKHVAIGAMEAKFHDELLRRLGWPHATLPSQEDKAGWDDVKRQLRDIFRQKSRDEWCALLEGTETCFAPVLSLQESPAHPHHRARGTFVDVDSVWQPAPAPRFSRTATVARPVPREAVSLSGLVAEWSR